MPERIFRKVDFEKIISRRHKSGKNFPRGQRDKCKILINILSCCPGSTVGEYLSDKTICMQSLQLDGQYTHYDVHSLYGWSETEPTMV